MANSEAVFVQMHHCRPSADSVTSPFHHAAVMQSRRGGRCQEPTPPSLFAFSSLSAQGPPLTVDRVLSLMVFLPFTSKADAPGTWMLFAWRQWEFYEVSSRAGVRQGIWKKEEMAADYECCGMVWQRLQALSDAVNCRSMNKSVRTSCVFILPDSRTTNNAET